MSSLKFWARPHLKCVKSSGSEIKIPTKSLIMMRTHEDGCHQTKNIGFEELSSKPSLPMNQAPMTGDSLEKMAWLTEQNRKYWMSLCQLIPEDVSTGTMRPVGCREARFYIPPSTSKVWRA